MTTGGRRVLVVDNDGDVRDAVRFILEGAGFEVLPAASVAEARACLLAEIIHAAVIDVRLQDDRKPGDASGFCLAKEMPATIPFVIFTGYENLQAVRTALGEVSAKAIVSKKRRGAAAELKRVVQQMFDEDVKANFALQIEGKLSPETIAGSLEIPEMPEPAAPRPAGDDVAGILRVLFRDASAITLAPLLPAGQALAELAGTLSQAGSVVAQVRPRLDHGLGAAKVVKFGARAEIEQEAQRYETFKDYAGGYRLPRLDGAAYSRQVGGLTYSLLGSGEGGKRLRVLGQFYAEETSTNVARVLGCFFRETFAELYGNAREESQDLAELYSKSLHLTPEKLRASLQSFHPEAITESTLRFAGLGMGYRNPYLFLAQSDRFRPLEAQISWCLCHGDLHARNLLVDDEGHFWLIDFARVGPSHAVRDFVELESDIKFNLLQVSDLRLLLPFEEALLDPQQFGPDPLPAAFGDPAIDKAYEVVVALRGLASELIRPPCDRRQYEQALLLHTLNILRLRHIAPGKKEHALLAAALLCERLASPITPSSPPGRSGG